jgi:transcriptional regulator with XRE-family HTH domain
MGLKNINKNQLAKVLSVGSSAVGKWVNGEITDLKLPSLVSISTFFDVSIDNLAFNNIEVQNELKLFYKEYLYLPAFEWEDDLVSSIKTKKVPKVLVHGEVSNMFVVRHSPEYYGIYPKKAVLVFERKFELTDNDVLLVRNKILKNILFISYSNGGYKSVLTHEIVDIDQYNIEGVLVNIILDQVFMDLS